MNSMQCRHAQQGSHRRRWPVRRQEAFAAEGYAAFPNVLTDEAADALSAGAAHIRPSPMLPNALHCGCR